MAAEPGGGYPGFGGLTTGPAPTVESSARTTNKPTGNTVIPSFNSLTFNEQTLTLTG
jgi:hypothetical protein